MSKTHSIMRERYISFMPSLAVQVGVEAAIVTQTLCWLVDDTNSGKEINGHRWVWNSIAQWQKKWFPFWPQRTLRRIFKNMEEQGLLLMCNPDGGSGVNYYRINEGFFEKLTLENSKEIDIEEDAGLQCRGHFGRDIAANLASPYITEPTTESSKGCRSLQLPHSGLGEFHDRNRRPYPTSEAQMYRLLEEAGIDPNPDRDGNFYDQMVKAKWCIRGKLIADWMAAYEARVEHNEQACKRP